MILYGISDSYINSCRTCLLARSSASFIYLKPALSFFHLCLSLSRLLGPKWPHFIWRFIWQLWKEAQSRGGDHQTLRLWNNIHVAWTLVVFWLSALQYNCRYSWYCRFHMILHKLRPSFYPYPAWVQYLRVWLQWQILTLGIPVENLTFHLPYHKGDWLFDGHTIMIEAHPQVTNYATLCDAHFSLYLELWVTSGGDIPT